MQKKNILPLFIGLFLFSASAGTTLAADDAKVLVTAGNETLTQAEFNQMLTGMPPELKAMMDNEPALLDSMLNRWADFSILAQEAQAQGLDKKPEVRNKLKDMTTRILVEAYLQRNTGKTEVSDQAVQDYYNSHKNEFSHDEMIKAQHILIKVDDADNKEEVAAARRKIADIKSRLDKGASFADLAKEFSDDPGSSMNGGDLGFFNRGSMVPAFEEAAFNTKKGDISEPILTQFGWHLIRVTDSKAAGVTPLAEVKEEIQQKVQAENQQSEVENILANLKEKYQVTIHQ